ncbi:glycosyltransferase family 4 protein [Gemmata sp.]|uniref:glycosyltransferase family 4 protein n=1 Tax=Gemmata sp. TaxID=1914242 RepID=UPI003F71BED5
MRETRPGGATQSWAILTGEYPPEPGGVSDYTRLVAEGLAAAGDAVTVYAPPGDATPHHPGVTVVRLPDHFGPRGLLELDHAIARRPRPDRVLVQYVPHAFGWKAMNVPFVLWVALRARRLPPVWVMFHEVAFPFSWRPARYALLGSLNNLMARLLAGAADRVLVSVPGWVPMLRRVCPKVRRPEWLPVPCNVGTVADPNDVVAVRSRYSPETEAQLIGHFGTYAPHVGDVLMRALTELLGRLSRARVLLMGRNSDRWRDAFASQVPALGDRIHATGELPPDRLPAHLRACDLLVQPYPDGVSSRRTSVMAGLANGVPVVTNLGPLSEWVWAHGAVALAPACDPHALAELAAHLLAVEPARCSVGASGQVLYRDTFTLAHTITSMRDGL